MRIGWFGGVWGGQFRWGQWFHWLAFPMRPGLTLQIAAVKLVNPLGADGTAFVRCEQRGGFFPRFAPQPLFADEIHERLKAAVEGASAAGLLSFRWRGIFVHQGIV